MATPKTRTKKTAKTASKISKISSTVSEVLHAKDITIDVFASQSLSIYGSYVVEDRAVPEQRDGLKPVHRAGLWAAYKLGLHHTAKWRKAAKIVGDVIGMYHPHGDQSAYGAIVNLSNGKPNLIRGEGNWGSPIDSAAAMRYTECRLSSFTDLFLMDKDYLKIVPMVPNFDGTMTMPLHLPALLPNLLLMGNPTAPAYGIRAGNPPFALDGVVKIIRSMLRGKTPTVKMLRKYLSVDFPYGCQDASTDADWETLLTTGKGSLSFVPVVEAVWDHKDKTQSKKILITSYSPGFRKVSIVKQLDKIANLKEVGRAYPRVSKKDSRSGAYGCLYIIEPARGVNEDAFYDLAEKVQNILTSKESYDLGCTIKNGDGTVKFARPTFVQFFNSWFKYRVELEISLIENLLHEAAEKIAHQNMLLYAVDNADAILDASKIALKKKSPVAEYVKILKIEESLAAKIFQLPLSRLAKLERVAIIQRIKELKAEVKVLKHDKKHPKPRIDKDLVARIAKYKITKPKFDIRK